MGPVLGPGVSFTVAFVEAISVAALNPLFFGFITGGLGKMVLRLNTFFSEFNTTLDAKVTKVSTTEALRSRNI